MSTREMAKTVLKSLQGDQDTLQKYQIKDYARGILKREEAKRKNKKKMAKASKRKNR